MEAIKRFCESTKIEFFSSWYFPNNENTKSSHKNKKFILSSKIFFLWVTDTLWASYIHFLSKIFFMIKWLSGLFIFSWRSFLTNEPEKKNKIKTMSTKFVKISDCSRFQYLCNSKDLFTHLAFVLLRKAIPYCQYMFPISWYS